jgi:GNAT superfamily N-acetyltransferase
VSIHYRPTTLEEVPAFAALHVRCWHEAYTGLVPQHVLDALKPEERYQRWRETLAHPVGFALGAYDGDVPIGFLHVRPVREDLSRFADGQIHGIYVLASHHRRGVGRAFFSRAAAYWTVHGKSLCVESLTANLPAGHFYKALGGVAHAFGNYEVGGETLPLEVHVFKDLDQLTTLN